jgi:hypothetical protein
MIRDDGEVCVCDSHTLRHWARERQDDCRSVNCSAADADVLSDRGERSRHAVESAMAESMNPAGGIFTLLHDAKRGPRSQTVEPTQDV